MTKQYRDYAEEIEAEMALDSSAARADALAELLGSISFMDDDERRQAGIETPLFTAARVRTYAEAMLLTRDDGLVVRLADGTEYQLTIQRSK
jgi:hypothetical protein